MEKIKLIQIMFIINFFVSILFLLVYLDHVCLEITIPFIIQNLFIDY